MQHLQADAALAALVGDAIYDAAPPGAGAGDLRDAWPRGCARPLGRHRRGGCA